MIESNVFAVRDNSDQKYCFIKICTFCLQAFSPQPTHVDDSLINHIQFIQKYLVCTVLVHRLVHKV